MKQLIRVSIQEASRLSGPSCEEITHYIEEEWIKPFEENLFDDEDVTRIRLIYLLLDEFGVNEESIPIILHLIDQIHALQTRMRDFSSEAEEP